MSTRSAHHRPSGLLFGVRLGAMAFLVASAACSSESGGESTQSVEQGLEAGQFVVLNEIEINAPGGADNPWQFIELMGTPGLSLVDFQVVAVDGGNGNAVLVVDLGTACSGPCAIGSNGILIIKAADSDAGPVGHPPAAGATVVKVAQLLTSSIPNGDTAVLLVEGPGAITEGSTLTVGDAGRAAVPAGDSVIDAVGWAGGGAYSGVALTQSSGRPDAATRLPGHLDTSVSAWYNGDLLGTSDTLVYDATKASSNLPAGAALTPGGPNLPLEVSDAGDGGDVLSSDAGSDSSDAARTDGSTADASSNDASVDAANVDAAADTSRAEASADVQGPDSPVDAPAADATPPPNVDASGSDATSSEDVIAVADAVTTDAVFVDAAAVDGAPVADVLISEASRPDGATDMFDASSGLDAVAGDAALGGAGGTGGTGAGGRAGAGGLAGAGGKREAGLDAAASPPAASSDSGCGCRTAAPRANGHASWMLSLVALAALRRRRKDHRS